MRLSFKFHAIQFEPKDKLLVTSHETDGSVDIFAMDTDPLSSAHFCFEHIPALEEAIAALKELRAVSEFKKARKNGGPGLAAAFPPPTVYEAFVKPLPAGAEEASK